MNLTQKKNKKNNNIKEPNKKHEYEPKKKYISQNPLLSSKNNVSTKDTYMHLSKYTKPFKNINNINETKKKNKGIEKDKLSNSNIKNEFNELKLNKKENINKNKIGNKSQNNENILENESKYSEKYISKQEEETITSFEKKPSEIQSPDTISEDSFITEISNFTNKKNFKNSNDLNDDNEDIVNYDGKKYIKNINKEEKPLKDIQKNKGNNDIINTNNCKKFNKNEHIKKNKILNDTKKFQSCKKISTDKFYNNKGDKNDYEKSNKKELCNQNQSTKKNNFKDIKEKYYLIKEYSNKKSKMKIRNNNLDEANQTEIIRDNNLYEDNINIPINKRHCKFEVIERNNSILNNNSIYIPVNQRKKIESNKKSCNNNDKDIFDSPKNKNSKNERKNILFKSTDLNFDTKQFTKRLDLIQKIKHNKNYSIEKRYNNNDSLGIVPKNILNEINNEGIIKKKEIIPNIEKIESSKEKKVMKIKKNNIIKKSYIRKNDDKNISFLDTDKFNGTNINFYKNKNKNNITKRNHKLFLSIDDINDQKTKKYCDISKISTIRNLMIYEPKKPNMKNSKSKSKKYSLYNRASYDPNNSNINTIRKKKFLKQSITTIDLINNINDKQKINNIDLYELLKRHTRNYSGINNSVNYDRNKQISEFIPNRFKNTIRNNYIFNNNNSHSIDRNSINMKIINSLNRSYDNNFYRNLNKLNSNNNLSNLLNAKDFGNQYISQNKNLINMQNYNNSINKTPNKNKIKNNSYLNNTMRENDKKKLNIYANNINNINNYLDINNPILKYNIKTNKDNNYNQNNNINIINSNNKNYINKERLSFFPSQRNLNLELDNQYNKLNSLNIHNYQNQSNLINLYNNNLIENNEFQNLRHNLNNSNNNYNFGLNLNLINCLNNQQKINNISLSIKLEDLILLLDKFNIIIINFNNNGGIVYNECFEFWNYYFNCSAYCQLEKLYMNSIDTNIIRISINFCLMSIMILYDFSFEIGALKNEYISINNILKLNYMNLMLISEHALKIVSSSKNQINNNSFFNNFAILKLYNLIDTFRKKGGFQNDFIEITPQSIANDLEMTNLEKISYNTDLITQYLRYILKNNKTSKNEILTSFFKKIKEKTYEEINTFFIEEISRISNRSGSILSSIFLNNNIQMNNKFNFRTMPSPYLRTKNNKNYSLVLDLDETLIHFKPGNTEEDGVVMIRPGVPEFLEEVGKYYELILFTTSTQEYADLLIDAIEEDKIYFDHRLYREHAIIIDNEFVKDLTKIGRPLDKIIIIDDMPQNFKLQKENGIIIRPFWGEDYNDVALYNLIPILKNIAEGGGDVRVGINKYKNEILKNITSFLC